MKIEKLTPAFKDYLWGGTKLREVYGKPCNYEKVAESWELSTHPAGQSRLLGGEHDGMELGEYFARYPQVLGERCQAFENFPVLIKFIDAKEPLSIQVHPSDEYALEVEQEYGKTEMWYVMDCEPGASLYFGVSRPVDREELCRRIADNTLEEVLNRVNVCSGDVFFIQSGTIHAIGGGILICEIQQNSNCTYRVYDYGRLGADGKPRELHIEKALAVSRLTPSDTGEGKGPAQPIPGGEKTQLASCKYFSTWKVTTESQVELEADSGSFVSVIVMEGQGKIAGPENQVEFRAGDSLFVPAGTGAVTVAGSCSLAVTRV